MSDLRQLLRQLTLKQLQDIAIICGIFKNKRPLRTKRLILNKLVQQSESENKCSFIEKVLKSKITAADVKKLMQQKKSYLTSIAEAANIKVNPRDTKKDIVKKIKASKKGARIGAIVGTVLGAGGTANYVSRSIFEASYDPLLFEFFDSKLTDFLSTRQQNYYIETVRKIEDKLRAQNITQQMADLQVIKLIEQFLPQMKKYLQKQIKNSKDKQYYEWFNHRQNRKNRITFKQLQNWIQNWTKDVEKVQYRRTLEGTVATGILAGTFSAVGALVGAIVDAGKKIKQKRKQRQRQKK
jgi:hypothetical protein